MKKLLLLALVFLTLNLDAQKQMWTQTVSNNAYMTQLEDGTIFIKDKKSIALLDHLTGEQKWESSVTTEKDPIFLNSLPFMYFYDKGFSIIDCGTGKIIQSVAGDKSEVLNTSYYWEKGRVVMEVESNKMLHVVNINLRDLSQSWSQEIGKVRKSFMGLVKNSVENRPSIGKDESLILVDKKYVSIVDVSGNIKNKIEFKKDITKQGFNMGNNMLYVLEDKKNLHFIDVASGKIKNTVKLKEKELNLKVLKGGENIAITQKKEIVFFNSMDGTEVASRLYKDEVKATYIDEETGDYFLTSKKIIEKLDPNTAEPLLSTTADTDFKYIRKVRNQTVLGGYHDSNVVDLSDLSLKYENSIRVRQIQEIYELDNAVMYQSYNSQKLFLNVIDNGGNKIWDKQISSSIEPTTFLTEKGIVVISGTSMEYFSLEDGESLWDKPKSVKVEPSFEFEFNEAGNLMVIHSEQRLFFFDLKSGELWKSQEKLKFKDFDYEAQRPQIMVLDKNIFLKGSRTFYTTDYDGNILDNFTYPPISTKSTLLKLSNVVITAGIIGAGHGEKVLNVTDRSGNQIYKGSMVDDLDSNWAYADRQRKERQAKQNISSNAYPYVYTKLENKKKGLIFLDPATGKERHAVTMDDKNPEYIVDDVDGLLFRLTKGKISAIDIK